MNEPEPINLYKGKSWLENKEGAQMNDIEDIVSKANAAFTAEMKKYGVSFLCLLSHKNIKSVCISHVLPSESVKFIGGMMETINNVMLRDTPLEATIVDKRSLPPEENEIIQ